jgi:hypothetical protein
VFEGGQIWRLVTFMFVHDALGFTHILFNMLALWMFGVDLERRWGTRGFVKYYAITGIGSGIGTALIALLPFDVTREIYAATTDRRVRRDIRAAAGVGGDLSAPQHSVHVHLPAAGAGRGVPHGRDGVSRRGQRT